MLSYNHIIIEKKVAEKNKTRENKYNYGQDNKNKIKIKINIRLWAQKYEKASYSSFMYIFCGYFQPLCNISIHEQEDCEL